MILTRIVIREWTDRSRAGGSVSQEASPLVGRSVGRSVNQSVHLSVRPSVGRSIRNNPFNSLGAGLSLTAKRPGMPEGEG